MWEQKDEQKDKGPDRASLTTVESSANVPEPNRPVIRRKQRRVEDLLKVSINSQQNGHVILQARQDIRTCLNKSIKRRRGVNSLLKKIMAAVEKSDQTIAALMAKQKEIDEYLKEDAALQSDSLMDGGDEKGGSRKTGENAILGRENTKDLSDRVKTSEILGRTNKKRLRARRGNGQKRPNLQNRRPKQKRARRTRNGKTPAQAQEKHISPDAQDNQTQDKHQSGFRDGGGQKPDTRTISSIGVDTPTRGGADKEAVPDLESPPEAIVERLSPCYVESEDDESSVPEK